MDGMKWQPIETAPQDGTHVLGWAEGSFAVVNFAHDTWWLSEVGSFAEDGSWYPTHWMPLPDPPAARETGHVVPERLG